MNIAAYLAEVRALYNSGQTTEHSFRPALARLFEGIDPTLTVINEPKRTVDVARPILSLPAKAFRLAGAKPKTSAKTCVNLRQAITARSRRAATPRACPT